MEQREIIKHEEESKEKKEKEKEMQRMELDPDEGIDIVIKTNPEVKLGGLEEAFKPVKVVLEKGGKMIFDFQEKLPLDYKFVFIPGKKGEKIWRCDKKYFSVVIMPEEWGSSKNILSLLHEIGHALQNPQKMKTIDVMDDEIEDLQVKLPNIEKEMSAGRRDEEIKNKLKNIGEQTRRLEKKSLKMRAEEERNAWAKALQIIREFKKKGIDLIKPFRGETSEETRENLDNFIHKFSLGSYEKLRIRDEGLKSLEGIFTKRL